MAAPARLDPVPQRSALFGDLVAVIGEEAALALAAAFGGEQLYVPAAPGADHPISRAIGPAAAAELARHYHLTHIAVPLGAMRRARVLALAAAGLKPAAIQRETRFSRNFVYKVLAEARDGTAPAGRRDDRQIDLFSLG